MKQLSTHSVKYDYCSHVWQIQYHVKFMSREFAIEKKGARANIWQDYAFMLTVHDFFIADRSDKRVGQGRLI